MTSNDEANVFPFAHKGSISWVEWVYHAIYQHYCLLDSGCVEWNQWPWVNTRLRVAKSECCSGRGFKVQVSHRKVEMFCNLCDSHEVIVNFFLVHIPQGPILILCGAFQWKLKPGIFKIWRSSIPTGPNCYWVKSGQSGIQIGVPH